jgi:hypothetical protein
MCLHLFTAIISLKTVMELLCAYSEVAMDFSFQIVWEAKSSIWLNFSSNDRFCARIKFRYCTILREASRRKWQHRSGTGRYRHTDVLRLLMFKSEFLPHKKYRFLFTVQSVYFLTCRINIYGGNCAKYKNAHCKWDAVRVMFNKVARNVRLVQSMHRLSCPWSRRFHRI